MTKLLGFKKLTVWLERQAPNRAHAQGKNNSRTGWVWNERFCFIYWKNKHRPTHELRLSRSMLTANVNKTSSHARQRVQARDWGDFPKHVPILSLKRLERALQSSKLHKLLLIKVQSTRRNEDPALQKLTARPSASLNLFSEGTVFPVAC